MPHNTYAFTREYLTAVSLAFIPLVISISLFFYIFSKFLHNKLIKAFYLFLIPFGFWQLNEVMIRLSVDCDQVIYWCRIFNPIVNFIPPLGLHFAIVFTRNKKLKKPLFLSLAIYLPALVFFLLSCGGIISFRVFHSPFWNWIVTYNINILGIINASWILISTLGMMYLLFKFAFFTKHSNQTLNKQSKIVFTGLFIPVLIASITEFIFPFILGKDSIPLLLTTFALFPLSVFIALYKYELFMFSPKYVWEDIISKMNSGVIILDFKRVIHYTNHFLNKITGYSGEELLNKDLFILIADDESKRAVEQNLENRKKGESGRFVLLAKKNNGDIIWCQVKATPYYDKKGNIIGSVALVDDISVMIILERSLQQKIKDLNTFIYKTSHDLRGPIATVMGLCLLALKEINDPEAKKYFKMIDTSASRLDNVLKNLQEINIISRKCLNPVSIHLLSEIENIKINLRFLKNYPHIFFELTEDDVEDIISDKMMVTKILEHLLINAIKYSDLTKARPTIRIRVTKVNAHFEIMIEDNGVGVPEEFRERLGDMFFRANNNVEGNGLGLYIVKTLLERLGGKMSLQSNFGKGTKVTLLIPLMEEESRQDEIASSKPFATY